MYVHVSGAGLNLAAGTLNLGAEVLVCLALWPQACAAGASLPLPFDFRSYSRSLVMMAHGITVDSRFQAEHLTVKSFPKTVGSRVTDLLMLSKPP